MGRRATPPRIGTPSSTRVRTIDAKTIYAADLSASRPLSLKLRRLAHDNRTLIRVGTVEELPHGTLRCLAMGDHLVVSLKQGSTTVGRQLFLVPHSRALLREGAMVPEAAFSVEIDEFIGTPWHELEYTSVWTVHGLRRDGKMELSVDR